MAIELEGLEFQIEAKSEQGVKHIDALANSLGKLKNATKALQGLDGVSDKLSKLNNALSNFHVDKLEALGKGLQAIGAAGNVKISASIPKRINDIAQAANNLDDSALDRLERLGNALQSISAAGTVNISVPTVQTPNVNQANAAAANGVAPQAATSQVQQATSTVQQYSGAVQQATGRTNVLKSILSGIGGVFQKGFHVGVGALKKLGGAMKSAGSAAGNLLKKAALLPVTLGSKLAAHVKHTTSALGGLFSSLKRIAMYRAIRAAIAALTQGFKDGINNLYQYSLLMGTTFSQSMDSLATSALYLKNSLGAMAAPLIEALAPAIDFIIEKVVTLFNLINQLFARITGKSIYTAAKKVATSFGEAADDASKAAKKAADKIKSYTVGIDELNIIQDNPNTGSGGGAGGGAGTDYGSMFEELPIDSSISDFADKLREAFENADWESLGRLLGAKVNEIFDSIDWKGIGTKLGKGIDGVVKTLYYFLDEIDFFKIGKHLAELLNAALEQIDFTFVGRLAVKPFTSLLDLIIGFLVELDWGLVTKSICDFFIGVFDECTDWLNSYDWKELGQILWQKIKDAIAGVDWGALATSLFTFLGTAIRSAAQFIGGFFGSIADDIKKWWDEDIKGKDWKETAGNLLSAIGQGFVNIGGWVMDNIVDPFCNALLGEDVWEGIKQAGRDVWNGFCEGVTEFFKHPLKWLKEHIVDPFVEGFKNLFGIHSPSTVMKEIGGYIVEGLLEGILAPFKAIGNWVNEHIFTPLKQAFEDSPVLEFAVGVVNGAKTWWKNVKNWWAGVSKEGVSLSALVSLVKSGWTKVSTWIGKIPVLSQGISLVKSAWTTVKNWVGNIPTLDQAIQLVKSGWNTVKAWIGKIPTLDQAIQLIKSGWNTVKEWIGNIPTLDQAIQLIKSGWTTVKNWIGNIPVLSQGIALIKSGWNTVKGWIGNIPTLDQAIQLVKSGWTTVKNWIGTIPILSQGISLIKSGWTTVKNWIGTIPVLSQGISLIKSGWTSVKNWIGNIPVLSQAISLIKSGWSSVSSWIGHLPVISQAISLAKSGWSTISGWIGSHTVSVGVSLFKSGWNSLSSWVGNSVSVGVSLFKSGWNSIKSFFGLSSGGYDTGHGWKFFKQGGFIDNGQAQFWNAIPKYADGTANAHGSMFVAGEAGPEMVGHVNGRSEVLNKSQLGQIMHRSIVDGMAQFAGYWQSVNNQLVTCTNGIISAMLVSADTLYAGVQTGNGYTVQDISSWMERIGDRVSAELDEAGSRKDIVDGVREGVYEATTRQNDLLREQNELLRRIADKDTKLQIGNKVIKDAVVTQEKADGYRFTK